MKIAICNIPLRPDNLKTTYPPLGALAVIQSLQSAGYDTVFYDINFFRPSNKEIRDYFLKNRFDVIGISATVSTSYGFVKNLVSIARSVLPETVIVVGGALTAASEILLRFNSIDFCIIGEGEKVIENLINYIKSFGRHKSDEDLKKVKGLCFIDAKGNVMFTGYEKQLSVDEIEDADYSIIEKYSDIDHYIIDPFFHEQQGFFYGQFGRDERSFQEHRKNKKFAITVSSRGCVNRCTFCHRWQRGIRIFPVGRIVENIKYMKERYNIGFLSFGDENFGATKKWIEEFIEKIKPLDMLYRIAGICCENIDLSLLKKLKQSGCVDIHYGFESGSDKMLRVMEKRANAELNEKVAKWSNEAGLQTVPHLLIGMPGESFETVKETSDFVERITGFLPGRPILGINSLVALPGAPVYEYARTKDLLGKTSQDEERYLLKVSGQGGASMRQLNLTDYPYIIVRSWIKCIYSAAQYNYCKKNNLPQISIWRLFKIIIDVLLKRRKKDREFFELLYSHPFFYHLRYFILPIYVMCKLYKEDKRLSFEYLYELLIWPFKRMFNRKKFTRYVSIRTLVNEGRDKLEKADIYNPFQLRMGR